MISVTIDAKKISVREGTTVLEAARRLGIDIPTLCFHERLIPYGACRVCTVEIIRNGQSSLHSSCSYPVEKGMIVKTNSERVINGRRMIVELLLARCPTIPLIQELSKKMGIVKPRFRLKHEDCILCGLCVVICHEVVGVGAIGFAGRGTDRKVTTPFELPSDICIACGACSYVCPLNLLEMEADTTKQFRTLPGAMRKCRYMQMGMISHKICPNSYQCWHCEIDQKIEDTMGCHPAFAMKSIEAKEIKKIEGFLIIPEYFYSPGHVWMKCMDGKLRIGIDDFARKVFGTINDIKLPPVGSNAERGKKAWTVRCGNKTVKMLFPTDGTVTDVNPYIEGDPSLINKDPYGRGWILTLEAKNLQGDLDRLLKGKRVEDWMSQDAKKLNEITGSLKVIDGTTPEFVRDLSNRLEEKEWNHVSRVFFSSRHLFQNSL